MPCKALGIGIGKPVGIALVTRTCTHQPMGFPIKTSPRTAKSAQK